MRKLEVLRKRRLTNLKKHATVVTVETTTRKPKGVENDENSVTISINV